MVILAVYVLVLGISLSYFIMATANCHNPQAYWWDGEILLRNAIFILLLMRPYLVINLDKYLDLVN